MSHGLPKKQFVVSAVLHNLRLGTLFCKVPSQKMSSTNSRLGLLVPVTSLQSGTHGVCSSHATSSKQAQQEPESAQQPEEEKDEEKRPKSVIPWETKRWFVAWSLAMQKKHKWNIAFSWRAAQKFMHELLGATNKHTHRRWPEQIKQHDLMLTRRNPHRATKVVRIPGYVLLRMSTTMLDLAEKGTALSTDIASKLLQQICEQEGIKGLTFVREWTRLLLRQLGLAWKLLTLGHVRCRQAQRYRNHASTSC